MCLASVLPQLVPFGHDVECVVSDNASPDHTADIVALASKTFPIRYSRNDSNIGIIANITRCASELANGEFIFLIGDDDVLTEGAIGRIMAALRTEDAPDLIVLNVGYLPRNHRPKADAAAGGVSTQCDRTLRKSAAEGRMPFENLFEGPTADLTASYSVVLHHRLWKQQFPEACFDEPFSSVRTTYPSAWVIARSMSGKDAIVIATPSVMIYEAPPEEYSWARFRAISSVVFATQLYLEFQRAGVSQSAMRPYFEYQFEHRSSELGDLLWHKHSAGGWKAAAKFVWLMRAYPLRLLKMLVLACNHPQAPFLFRWPVKSMLRIKQCLKTSSN